MNYSKMWIFLLVFALLALQMLLGLLQVRQYQKAVKGLLGSGVLGIGQRKGGLKSGELLILSYDRTADCVVACRSMKGITIFAAFKDQLEHTGKTLAQIREIGVALDAKELYRYRKRHPYNPAILSKKKGALIQAVEAIELRLSRDSEKAKSQDIAAISTADLA